MGSCISFVIYAIILAVLSPVWFCVVIIGCIAFLILNAVITSKQLKDVEYAMVKSRTKIMKTKTRPSGFSIGSRGSFRSYWRFREEVDRIEVQFEVHYKDGRICTVTAIEGTSKYEKFMAFVGRPPKTIRQPQPKVIDPPPVEKEPAPIVQPVKIEEKPKTKTVEARKKEEKRYVEVPFEVMPNEYNLKVQYPSCQMEVNSREEHRIYVRFGITYDSTVKGVRNRVVTCATIDCEGRMTNVHKDYKVLDMSGSKMVDITFWKNAEEEPAKILVGLDRHT